jgi:hypothetical protein
MARPSRGTLLMMFLQDPIQFDAVGGVVERAGADDREFCTGSSFLSS